jgi:electron transfer flavoprotein alpha subunit
MSNKIWVYIDQYEGKALPASWEGIGAAKELSASLGEGVTAVILGQSLDQLAQEAFQAGADEVLVGDDPILKDYRPEPYSTVLSRQAKESQPQVLLFPTTTRGRELAAMVAIDLSTGVMPDVIALDVDGDTVVVTRPVYAGKLLSKARCETRPQIITLRVRAFTAPEKDPARSGTPIRMDTSGAAEVVKSQVEGYVPAEGGVSLTDAAVIVSGGRGVSNNPSLTPPAGMDEKEAEIWKAQQGFQLIGGLAQVLGGAVGASRAAVDAGYIPYTHQVGQTGKVVSPDLYIAVGISGAIQHLAGMRSSKTIVAVNKDPDAPIFKLARFGVVGDMHEIVPLLTEALRQRLGK